ncbi:MAG TPA: hypothetical protein VM680_05095 [Verrucomicrobiae bacterium]|nr:hypothetical protein [Verrucomicrobiae bacterium]
MEPKPSPPTPPLPDIPFVNEMRLNARLWLATIAILAGIIFLTPRVWKRIEKFEVTLDYRIPYSLSKDYWLYQRRLEQHTTSTNILLIGDSVIWGEYVLPDGTLSHFLNDQTKSDRFINAGVNGLYPLAIEGLINHYANLKNRKIILHCNVLWMSSPKADLQDPKAQSINHSRLLPQFTTRFIPNFAHPVIPGYKADANERLSVFIERNIQFMSWVTHLQSAYFDDKSIPAWSLQSDDNDRYPNSYRNPFAQIALRVPSAPADDPERGPKSARHKPWTQNGGSPTTFEWLNGNDLMWRSFQWGAFLETLTKLQADQNDVFVVFGPFNTHIITPENMAGFESIKETIVATLKTSEIPFATPETLPSDLYADASHPLTAGYELLAKRLLENPDFRKFVEK